ncbi:Mss4p nuclear export [Chytriomyces hyalinus]|nr:Mss4p nuclear export [Chytriomyces hyalinus]
MKRKPAEEEDDVGTKDQQTDDEDEDDQEIIDVDFDFFDPKETDFHGLKTLAKQTFSNDADEFDLSGIADGIIAQPYLGSVVKADGAADPYAIMTVLGMSPDPKTGKLASHMQTIKDYILKKSSKSNDATHHEKLSTILSKHAVGLLVNERLINMPPQIVVPMLKMLIEELQWSIEEKKLAKPFEYLLLISKTYVEVEPTTDEDGDAGPSKKKKKKGKQVVLNFQIEDEVFEKHAEFQFDFQFSNQNDHAELLQTAGIKTSRRIYVLKASKLQTIHDAMKEFIQ